MTRPLVFDLDGTLVDSLSGIAAALNRALDTAGLPTHGLDAVRSFVGNGSLELARRALPPQSPLPPEELEKSFRLHYTHTWQEGTHPYPGIPELLDRLHGRPLAVLSNKPDPFTRDIVATLFPPHTFQHVIGQSARFPRKPAPDALLHLAGCWSVPPQALTLIGDSLPDLETAANAGSAFIGVAWGYHPLELGPATVASPAALATALGLPGAAI